MLIPIFLLIDDAIRAANMNEDVSNKFDDRLLAKLYQDYREEDKIKCNP